MLEILGVGPLGGMDHITLRLCFLDGTSYGRYTLDLFLYCGEERKLMSIFEVINDRT